MGIDKLAEAARRIAELEAALKAANEAKAQRVTLKVSTTGLLSVYGLGRFPVTLSAKAWRTLIGMVADIEAFIKANEGRFSTGKDDPRFIKARAEAAQKRAEYASKSEADGF